MDFNQHMDAVFNSRTNVHFVEFKNHTRSALETVFFHILAELHESYKRSEHTDRLLVLASVGQSELDGFITISTSNIEESCRAKLEVIYHTGLQSIWLSYEECEELVSEGKIEEETLKEDRVFLYECNVHFCTLMLKQGSLASFIADEVTKILNSLFNKWDVLFQGHFEATVEANIHFLPLDHSILSEECNRPLVNLAYGDKVVDKLQDFTLLYNIDVAYTRFLSVIEKMESRRFMSTYEFETDFSVFSDHALFTNASIGPLQTMIEPRDPYNFGVTQVISLDDPIFPFSVRLRFLIAHRPALITSTQRRTKDSYCYREWSNDELVTLSYRERQVVVEVSILTDTSEKFQDESYISKVEYGFVYHISRFKKRTPKVVNSLKRIVSMQYKEAIYLYVEEKLIGIRGLNVDFLAQLISFLVRDENEVIEQVRKKAKYEEDPFVVTQEELFDFNQLKNNFE